MMSESQVKFMRDQAMDSDDYKIAIRLGEDSPLLDINQVIVVSGVKLLDLILEE